ncbi:MAG: DUF6716 putative glycosyltransferase, partial [Planctomycetota bacterium]
MTQQRVFFVGTQNEIGHHAAPLKEFISYSIVTPGEIFDCAQPGDLAIFYSEHFDRFRNAIRKLKENQVATLYMIDGILEWRNAWINDVNEPACPFTMRPILCDKAACIGHAQKRILDSWGNDGKTEVIGIPRFLRNQLRTQLAGDATKSLLIMTAKCPAYTDEQREKLLVSLRDIRNFVTNSPQWNAIWRLTDELEVELGVASQVNDFSGKELSQVLNTVDAVVTTSSTAMLEAMNASLPTAILDYHHYPHYAHAAWTIRSCDDVKLVLDELYDPPAHAMDYQAFLLRDELQLESCSAMRMVDLISQMQSVAKEAISKQQPLRFPSLMLEHSAISTSAASPHDSLYPSHQEFKKTDLLELQTELAHSRREIMHLNRELTHVR